MKVYGDTHSDGKEDGIMDREKINDLDTEGVVGGSIIFNSAHTTCGRKNNHEYKVLDYPAVDQYIRDNCRKMSEKTMINNMIKAGYLVSI